MLPTVDDKTKNFRGDINFPNKRKSLCKQYRRGQEKMYCFSYGKSEIVKDSFQAFLVKDAHFTATEEYPIIPSEFVSKSVPIKIMPFSKAICYRGDLSDTFICTYESDSTFERVRRNPQRYVSFFKRTAGLIGFDYSIHTDMPIIKQKAQMNDNLSLTYYFGGQGVSVIPNVRCGVDDLQDEYLSSLPRNTLIAVGVHGFQKYKFERYEWYCFLEKIIEVLEPTGIIVYGSLNDPIFKEFKDKTNFYFFEPWIYSNRKVSDSRAN